MSDDGLAKAVAAGERLSVVLEPVPNSKELGRPLDLYVECYPLPHVCIQDGKVWGATRRGHVVHAEGKLIDSIVSFFYTNAAPLYGFVHCRDEMAALKGGTATVRVLSQRQYQVVRFTSVAAGKLVWSDETARATDALRESVEAGNGHYVVYRDEAGIVRSHPLDLAFVFPASNTVRLMPEHAILPEPFIDPAAFLEKLRASVADFDARILLPKFHGQSDMLTFSSFRRIEGNGHCFDPAGLLNGRRLRVTDIRVFANP